VPSFRDVSNALCRLSQKLGILIRAIDYRIGPGLARFVRMRFRLDLNDYVEVLTTNETNYFSCELALAQAQLQVQALVQRYHSLGAAGSSIALRTFRSPPRLPQPRTLARNLCLSRTVSGKLFFPTVDRLTLLDD